MENNYNLLPPNILNVKIHQIWFRLRLCPWLRQRNLQRSPEHLAGLRGATSKGREKRKRKTGGGKQKRKKGNRKKGEVKWEKTEKGRNGRGRWRTSELGEVAS